MKSNYTNLVTGLYRDQVKGDKGMRVRIEVGASVQHPISIRSASDGTRWQSGGSMLRRIAIALLMILTLGVGQMWASTTATLYYAVDASIVACNTVTCYYNFGYSQTGDVNMTKTNYTKDGKLIYSVTLTANHDNVDALYFKPKGSSDGEQLVMSGWTALSTNSGKLYVHNTGWTTYSKDASYSVYCVKPTSWGAPKAYAFNSDCDKNANWPGTAMTSTGNYYDGKLIYKIDFNKRYATIIFTDGTNQTDDLELGSTYTGKMWNGSSWVTYAWDNSVSVSAGSNGSVSPSGTVTLYQGTGTSITATPNNGYYFTGWTITGGGITPSSSTNATETFRATTTGGTIQANFAKRWVLRGSREDGETAEGMPLWSTTTADMTVSEGTSTKTVTLLPNRTYKYMIHDKANPTINGNTGQRGCTSDNQASATQPASTAWKLNGTNPVFFNTAGYGTYTFSITVDDGYPSVTITNPTSWQITMGTKTCTDGCGSPEEVGGTNTAVDGDGYTIVNNNYVKHNGSVTFTAVPNSGYQFMGWVTSAACNAEPIATITPYTISNITSEKTMYAWFKEILFTVPFSLNTTAEPPSRVIENRYSGEMFGWIGRTTKSAIFPQVISFILSITDSLDSLTI